MCKRSVLRTAIVCSLLVMVLPSACREEAGPEPAATVDPGYVSTSVAESLAAAATSRALRVTATATETPLPTATPSPLPPTPEPTSTPTAVPTTLPTLVGTVAADGLRVRKGPGTTYVIAGALYDQDEVEITARNEVGDWLAIITAEGLAGWVYAEYVSLPVPVQSIPMAAEIPATPVPTATPEA